MWQAMMPVITALMGLFGGGGSDKNSGPTNYQRYLTNTVLDTQAKRMLFQNPLYEAVTRLAMRLQPTAVQSPMPSWDSLDPLMIGKLGESKAGGDRPRGNNPPTGTAEPKPGTAQPKPNGGGGTGGDGGVPPSDPGQDNGQGPNPNVTIGSMGINPATLAQLFGRQY